MGRRGRVRAQVRSCPQVRKKAWGFRRAPGQDFGLRVPVESGLSFETHGFIRNRFIVKGMQVQPAACSLRFCGVFYGRDGRRCRSLGRFRNDDPRE